MPEVLQVTSALALPLAELELRASPSGGPGGQHANKASTRIEVRFDVAASPSLTARQRTRLLERLGSEVRVVCNDERSQHRNRQLALGRLAERLAAALEVDPPRRPTRPSRGAVQRRLDTKRRRSAIKASRRAPAPRDLDR